MALVRKHVLKNLDTNEYLTESGWSTNVGDAKAYELSDLDSLATGNYVVIYVCIVS